ncbi:uncharacterized protein MONBRDRAFT_9042 [Monosiga brevicollis MX1]|uniref:Apple domain-containing protein n=1 Tax=Monosiga brevicollis TaxID=81824 RepID=A9V1X0_MONBE|nr:uncharacterized protein MONBRDRAFT_9042 [Monosiga brevicollis MX1]EDQ88517.1 predicted protein [Monosiga brevicollis MX1]|eukprot:XP_001746621.1 hypothetical protein [Monosiga brevicollis MX1]
MAVSRFPCRVRNVCRGLSLLVGLVVALLVNARGTAAWSVTCRDQACLQTAVRNASAFRGAENITVTVMGPVTLTSSLQLGARPEHTGTLIFRGNESQGKPGAFEGGHVVTAAWHPVQLLGIDLWAARAPASLQLGDNQTRWRAARQLYIDGQRYSRTRSPPDAVGLTITNATGDAAGYATTSTVPLAWPDPAAVELVSDHTWVQHRCLVANTSNLTAVSLSTSAPCTANWSMPVLGASPGSSLKQVPLTSYQACQQACCQLGAACKAVDFRPGSCYLLDRTYDGNYSPHGASKLANMNPANVPVMRSRINMAQPCFTDVQNNGQYSMTLPSFLENTANFTGPGQWFYDQGKGIVYVWPLAEHVQINSSCVVLGGLDVLVNLHGAERVELTNLTLAYSSWLRPSTGNGFVERYGTIFFANGTNLAMPPAALQAAFVSDLNIEECSFLHLGSWAMAVGQAVKRIRISQNLFYDVSGGSLVLGALNGTHETDPQLQTAEIVVADNVIQNMSVEYKGAPGLHSFCLRDSIIEHNRIDTVGYSGISYNWPLRQGPTLGPNATDPSLGFTRNNAIRNNDIARFMTYMMDGGGIHTIGRTVNTTLSGNYFHDMGAGAPGWHSVEAQSVIYIDNWSCGYAITNNVLEHCNATKQGYYFFQGPSEGTAHDNVVDGLYLRDAGSINPNTPGMPCNCSNVHDVVGPWPATAAAIIAAAGPRRP